MQIEKLVCSMGTDCHIDPVTNPLHLLECGHFACKQSILILQQQSESKDIITITCKQCGQTHDLTFAKDLQKHALFLSQSQNKDLLNSPKLDSLFFSCSKHPDKGIIYKCTHDGDFLCSDCIFDHLAHAQGNLLPFNEANIFSEIKQKSEQVKKFQKEMETFMIEINQIENKVRKTDDIRLKAIFEKFDLYIKTYSSI